LDKLKNIYHVNMIYLLTLAFISKNGLKFI
jgi:hypothetical protein